MDPRHGASDEGAKAGLFQAGDQQIGQDGGGATLALDAGLRPPAPPAPGLGQRIAAWADGIDLVVDLGARIGSLDWFRGAATCAALCWAAIHFAPGVGPLAAPTTPALAAAQWDEARALAIAPIAYGADTGQRIAATDAVEPLMGTPERPVVDLTATLGLGDGFAHVLARNGVDAGEARRVADLVGRQIALGAIRPGTRIDITLGRRPALDAARPLDFLRFRAAFDLKLAVARVGAGFRVAREAIPVDATPLRISGLVGASLYRSARESGAPAQAIAAYLKLIAGRVSLDRDIAASDRFDLVVAQRRAATGEVETGELLYAGLDAGARRLQLLKWNNGGRAEWFDGAGTGETHGQMLMPVNGHETSAFGMRRHPILGYTRFHRGMDIGAPYGAPILAATDGTVTYAGRHGGHGNFVRVDADRSFGTGYAHMSRIAVRSGQRVARGQIIGYVGSSGLSTGPHLHYEVYRDGQAVNPMSVSFQQTSRLAGAELGRFRAAMTQLLAVKPGTPALPRQQSATIEPTLPANAG